MILQRRLSIAVAAVVFFLIVVHFHSGGIQAWKPPVDSSLDQTHTQQPLEQSYDQPLYHSGETPPSSEGQGDGRPPHTIITEPSRIVVIASTSKEDVKWLREELRHVNKAIYRVDDPNAEYTVPKNKGHESMVYLTYLIDHYDHLPDVMVFLHAHRLAWHNNDLLGSNAVEMINALSSPYVLRHGYVNMRCHWDPGCPEWMHPFDPSNRTDISKPEERELAQAFAEIFPGRQVPETMATACCAQFALSRAAARRNTLEELKAYRDWILQTTLPDVISGRVWEYLWHYIFTGKPVVCPKMDLCYCDGFGVCFGGVDNFDSWFDRRNDMKKLQSKVTTLEKLVEERGGNWKYEEMEAKKELEQQASVINGELMRRLDQAKQRGADPKLRAEDSHREWHEGDGF